MLLNVFVLIIEVDIKVLVIICLLVGFITSVLIKNLRDLRLRHKCEKPKGVVRVLLEMRFNQ